MFSTQKQINHLAYQVVGCAIEVHKHLGPGLLESVYHECLLMELEQQGHFVQSQLWVPILYKGTNLEGKLKLDLLVENTLIVELKAVENILPVYKAQLLSYLKLAEKPKGLLINFHCENIVHSVISLVTPQFATLPVS